MDTDHAYTESILAERAEDSLIVYHSLFSRDGEYLVSSSSTGRICGWKLDDVLNRDWLDGSVQEEPRPAFSFQAAAGPIYSMAFAGSEYLFSGTVGGIGVWRWEDILASKDGEVRRHGYLQLPLDSTSSKSEINGVAVDEGRGIVFGGAGDSNAYMWDYKAAECPMRVLKGHTDYIHAVAMRARAGQALTASEDGSVRSWDIRTQNCLHTITPPTSRSHGKWISAMAVDSGENWMVCGGGAKQLTLWHLGSHSKTAAMMADAPLQTVTFSDDTILSGGVESEVYHWTMTGSIKSRVPTSSSSLFSLAVNDASPRNRVLVSSGNSRFVDVFANFYHRAFSLKFT